MSDVYDQSLKYSQASLISEGVSSRESALLNKAIKAKVDFPQIPLEGMLSHSHHSNKQPYTLLKRTFAAMRTVKKSLGNRQLIKQ